MTNRKTRLDKINFSEEDIIKIENLAALGLNMEQIASIFNISSDTLYRRCNEEDSNLSATILRGRSKAIQKVSEKAFELALRGDVGLIKYILSCKGGWTEKSQLIHEGTGTNIKITIDDRRLRMMAQEVLNSIEVGKDVE